MLYLAPSIRSEVEPIPTQSPLSPANSTSPRIRALAEALRQIILSLPEGALIGRESDLCLRLGCNQAMLRQVARQLEGQGLIKSRRGPAGGYFAARPSVDVVVDLAAVYMVSCGVTLETTLRAAEASVIGAARLAASRSAASPCRGKMEALLALLSDRIPEDTGSLEFIIEEREIDGVIFDMIDLLPLKLYMEILNRFSLDDYGISMFERQPQRRRVYRDERLRTLAAILGGDADKAGESMESIHRLIYEWLSPEALSARVGQSMSL